MVLSIARVALVLAASVGYLALAVLGWGGTTAFFSQPARIAITIAIFVMAGASLFVGGNMSSGVCEDRSNRWVIAVFGLSESIDRLSQPPLIQR